MLPWNIAKSAEAIFSRFAVRRICKFLLKKKLGQFILGDIDLDQLDVQLTAGTIHLCDLALNVDHLNHELEGIAPIKVRAGSIHSLLLKMPWSGEGCHVEIDELELQLVLANSDSHVLSKGSGPCYSSQDDSTGTNLVKHIHHVVNESTSAASISVHEGVKAVANMIKSFLSSFHVKIKKVIVAVDPCSEKHEAKTRVQKTLVLRVTEIECGTHISPEDFLHISHLTSFLKFQGATLELLQLNDAQNEEPVPSVSGWTNSHLATTTILTGEKCGFSGTLKISLPWNNCSLDIRKVDADVHIDPINVKFEPSILKWIFMVWETLKSHENEKDGHDKKNASHCNDVNSTSSCSISALDPTLPPAAKNVQSCRGSSVDLGTPLREEKLPDILLPESNLIFDWVPFCIGKNKKDRIEEVDLGASFDQFFECLDGMRSSHSLLGSSGMWNWTCSVFSAITAASSLASGSSHFPVERQHIETNLKVNLSDVSVAFFFFDEDPMDMQDSLDHIDVDSNLHYVGSRWVDIVIMMQVCPKEWKFEATVKNIDLDDYLSDECEVVVPGLDSQERNAARKTLFIQNLQNEVQKALPPRSVFIEDSDVVVNALATYSPLFSVEGCASSRGFKSESSKIVKASLLKTYGTSSFQIIRTSTFSNGCFTGPTSFSLKLPPFIFWVNLNLLNKLVNLLVRIQGSHVIESSQHDLTSTVLKEKQQSVCDADAHGRYYSGQKTTSLDLSLQGNIFFPNARVILCFPFKSEERFASYISWDRFISLEFSTLPETEGKAALSEELISMDKCSLPSSCSLHLNIAAVDIYLLTMASYSGHNSANMEKLKFSSHRVLSLSNKAGYPSVLSMLWPKNAVTGSWINKSAKLLATTGDFGTKYKSVRKGYEFASVATRKDVESLNSQTRKEMVLSSEFLLHFDLSSVVITLNGTHYAVVNHLLEQLIEGLFCNMNALVSHNKETSAAQRSILVECDGLEILVNFDSMDCTNSSLQIELPGSWNKMKLDVNNFQVLFVSNTGGTRDANFIWLSHAEGKLCGSVTDVLGQEFVLIVCNNNAMGRGDGEGLNVLSSRTAGSDIIHFYDSESIHNFISVTVKCGTIVAPGGRLDWLDCLCSVFRLPSQETDQLSDNISLREAKLQDDVTARCSFILNLVDVGLSYEPHDTRSVSCPSALNSNCGHSFNVESKMEQPIVACLLAASSLKVSNTTVAGTYQSEYYIQIQDVGLLLHAASIAECLSHDYSFGYLHKIGYIKVASEALLEAVLRINLENDLVWELDCFESHIVLSTCHDTTIGLMHLASQIQQLLAPDVEESLVHFQNRWHAVQQMQGRNSFKVSGIDAHNSSLLSEVMPLAAETESADAGLLDIIYEDAFHFHADCLQQLDLEGTEYNLSVDRLQQGETFDDKFFENLSEVAGGSFVVTGSEGHRTSVLQKAELIEGYCLSELCPLSELTINDRLLDEIPKSELLSVVNRDVRKVNSGWYGNTSFQILDNHISDGTDQISPGQVMDEGVLYMNRSGIDNCGSFKGRVHLNNFNVRWQMFSGSDWHDLGQNSGRAFGRDRNVCLELDLLNIKVQYDIFPEEDISVSKLCLYIEDLCLYDKSKRAPWKLVLGYYDSKEHPRESLSKALKLNLEAVRPDPSTPLEEYRLHIAVLPLLLHLHQSQLDFLIEFIGGKSTSADLVSQNILSMKSNDSEGCTVTDEALLPFFQKFDIQPIVLRVDYQPSRVDLAALSGGKYVELVNVVPWKGVELQLIHVQEVGVYGWKNLCEIMMEQWLEDISRNQIHKLLHGLPPIRSLVAVGSGAAKLVSLPINSYRKDQKLVKGLQRGTIAFLRSISVEAIRLGVHLAAGAHDILLHTESILACMQPSVPWPLGTEMKTNVRSDQPRNAQQGLHQAYESLSDGLGRTTSAIIRSPMKTYQRGSGAGSALVTAVRGGPVAAIAPASAAVQALHCALLGLRNTLDPEHKKESINKYSGRSFSSEQS